MFKPVRNTTNVDADLLHAFRKRENDPRLNEALQRLPRIARNYLPVVVNDEDPYKKHKSTANLNTFYQYIGMYAFFTYASL